jgi:hypothetical protein
VEIGGSVGPKTTSGGRSYFGLNSGASSLLIRDPGNLNSNPKESKPLTQSQKVHEYNGLTCSTQTRTRVTED